jgi:uncharacterized membrane protein
MTDRSRIAAVYVASAAGSLAWMAAIFAAPYLWSRGGRLALVFYACFSSVCHQIPERSFWVFGHPMAVCARCFGIYAGFLGGLLPYPFVRGLASVRMPKLRTFILFSLPIGIDTAGNFLRLWSTGRAFRFATGLLWGTVLPYFFVTGIADLAIHLSKRRSERKPPMS